MDNLMVSRITTTNNTNKAKNELEFSKRAAPSRRNCKAMPHSAAGLGVSKQISTDVFSFSCYSCYSWF